MRVFWLCIPAGLLCQGRQVLPSPIQRASVQQVTSNTAQGLAACTQTCLEQYPGPLVCTHKALFDSDITKCVQTTCPLLTDLLTWENRYAEECGLEARDDGARELVIAYVFFGISTLSAAARLLSRSRWLEGPGFWWDDWIMLAMWFITIEMAVCPFFSRTYWSGRDVIGFVTVHDIERVLMWTYVSEPFYLIGTFGTKLVWVFLYLRMWEANTMFRKLCWVTVGLLAVVMVGYPIGAIVTLWPHRYYIGESAIVRQNFWGIDLIPAVIAIGVQIVLFDFWTLLLPIPKLIRLTGVSKQRRTAICAVILLGFVVTGCSIVRLTVILPLQDSRNPNWDFGHFGTWSEIELHLSMISCNLPAIAGLVHRMMLRRRRMTSIGFEDELEDSDGRSKSRTLTTKTGQSIDIEEGSTFEAELVEDESGKIVMRKKKREQPG
ncbi:hypothetical protein CLAFUW4_07352 [Fulvia fulva]|uniref:Rhodopsin domain-containing protein n=1 Tax=Passalora fulva TaxID=5499 RepID=A0A9Q8UQP2_PASFU|nr:uncharacterized protein CLAFUR5_07481 [Fulvia fulva]KAK4621935.1 hypothetical protein CLAFUR4_07359 [Fulvia fulva]KAK4622426.1 hypothetical protein CLAFUR0_07356 [Fulvia fulva]UJO18923.1 hypothetical protein CLAFUR5_07481 [Fulvia fulva]WPV16527.1 hypothetical protein CLAFUW4_07352 [Fulvia fulva]WPV31255.1 hypothetical protein CLAFUW7_07353 [Fulvia fulva]